MSFSDHVMIDPFGNQTARLADGRFRMMNAIQCRAGMERLHVDRSALAQFTIRRDDGTFAVPCDDGHLTGQYPDPLLKLELRVIRNIKPILCTGSPAGFKDYLICGMTGKGEGKTASECYRVLRGWT